MEIQLAKNHSELILAPKCVQGMAFDMAIGAHQDDIEVMCPMGIIDSYKSQDKGFVGVVATDGGGSPRSGYYKYFSNEEMVAARNEEQKLAAKIGDYAALALLNYTSKQAKDMSENYLIDDLKSILTYFKPKVVYVHNLLDKHPTHTAIAVKSIHAIRQLSKEIRPQKLYGCEVWRSLDWLNDDLKVIFDLTGKSKLLKELLSVFKSQLAGGKRYDRASEGRRIANATFTRSHSVDKQAMAAYAMDLTALIDDDTLDIRQFAESQVERFKQEILL